MQSSGTKGMQMRGMPVILLTTVGAKTGKIRKTPLMRVEHDGQYAIVASLGGAPWKNPVWYYKRKAHPQCRAAGRHRFATTRARAEVLARRRRRGGGRGRRVPGLRRLPEEHRSPDSGVQRPGSTDRRGSPAGGPAVSFDEPRAGSRISWSLVDGVWSPGSTFGQPLALFRAHVRFGPDDDFRAPNAHVAPLIGVR